jgi:D-alanyl-D-alanine carboxypeptidase
MQIPDGIGTKFLRAGVVLLVVAVAGAGVAEAKPKKKRVAARPAAARVVADSGVWKRGYADIVIDANTGKVLHEENADALRHPASVTKVMTLFLLFEQLDTKKLRLDSDLPVSAYAASQQPSKLGVKAGTTIKVEDAIKALVTRSANDCAVVIAEAISGDSSSFAALMTRKARALGMSRTTFRNPNGLPDPEQVTTARDLATLGRAIQERFPRYYGYFATRSFYYKGVAIRNHNRLMDRVEGMDGIKTGYTSASGFNLLTNVERDGRHLVAVVLGGTSAGARDARMAGLISDNLTRAYAGRQTVAPIAEAPMPADGSTAFANVVASLPAEQPKAQEPKIQEAKVQEPVQEQPKVVTMPAPNARFASAAMTANDASDATLTTSAISLPAPTMKPAATAKTTRTALPAPGSAEPIVPVAVKTVAVPRPAAPTASMANQPGTLGTLTFSGGKMIAQPAPAAARPAPVQVASAGPVALPQRAVEPAPAPASNASRSGWAIQIGAYGSEADAQAQIAKARSKAGAPLAKADPYTETATKGATKIVRARFAGFDAEDAAQDACKALKRNAFGCMVFRN